MVERLESDDDDVETYPQVCQYTMTSLLGEVTGETKHTSKNICVKTQELQSTFNKGLNDSDIFFFFFFF
ncbi:hypothetical protein P3381_25015, partial [Vibrio parahaemolyticus]|nr:hypothetical protein [Vibrio parahaemolyticus]